MKTQADLVADDQGFKEKYETRKVVVPGINMLHTKKVEEIAEVLALIMKSQNNIVELRYKLGEHIELVYETTR